MKEITLRAYLHITSRKRDTNGKLINNALTNDLKIQENDFLEVSMKDMDGKYVWISNDGNGKTRKARIPQFHRMLEESCEWEEWLMI